MWNSNLAEKSLEGVKIRGFGGKIITLDEGRCLCLAAIGGAAGGKMPQARVRSAANGGLRGRENFLASGRGKGSKSILISPNRSHVPADGICCRMPTWPPCRNVQCLASTTIDDSSKNFVVFLIRLFTVAPISMVCYQNVLLFLVLFKSHYF